MEDESFGVTSIYGAQNKRGYVEITLGRSHLQVTPAKAREVAAFLLEAATAAEGDEVLMRVLDRVGMSRQRASQVLLAMRQERHEIQRRARQEMREALAFHQEEADLGD